MIKKNKAKLEEFQFDLVILVITDVIFVGWSKSLLEIGHPNP